MKWRRHIVRSGSVCALLAWALGAVLLGLGNAFIKPVETGLLQFDRATPAAHVFAPVDPHLVGADAMALQHTHHADPSNEPAHPDSPASHHETPHHEASGPLPAHCLFCLDGLSASSISLVTFYLTPVLGATTHLRSVTSSVGFADTSLTPPVRAPPALPILQA